MTATATAMAMNGDDDADCTTRSRDPSVFPFSWVPPSMVRGSVRVVVGRSGSTVPFWRGGSYLWILVDYCWNFFFGVLNFWIDGFCFDGCDRCFAICRLEPCCVMVVVSQ